MSIVTVFIDWQHEVWTDTPAFADAIDDITTYVQQWRVSRGQNKEFGNVMAGTAELTVWNADGYFSPAMVTSPLHGFLLPWRPVQIETAGGDAIYRGFIAKIRCHAKAQVATIYCTDGLDLIARHMITLNKENRTSQSVGAAIDDLLDALDWPAAARTISMGGGNLKYPQVTE